MENIDSLILVVLLTASLAGAVITDLRFQKIPNWLTLSTLILGSVYHIYLRGLSGLLFSIEGVIVGIAVLIIPYLLGGMGAGDAKLMGAVGALLGPTGVFLAFLLTALIGGIYALGVLAWQGFLLSTFRRYWTMSKEFIYTQKFRYVPPPGDEKSPRLRYGVAITLGTLISVFLKNEIFNILNII